MIVRIMGEGQFEIPDSALDDLNGIDERVTRAIEGGDEATFQAGLEELLSAVRNAGAKVPDDFLGASDLALPPPDATLAEVEELLGEEGLLPG